METDIPELDASQLRSFFAAEDAVPVCEEPSSEELMQILIQGAVDESTEEESLSTGNSSDTPSNSVSHEQKSDDKWKWLSSLIEAKRHFELSKSLSEVPDVLAGENGVKYEELTSYFQTLTETTISEF